METRRRAGSRFRWNVFRIIAILAVGGLGLYMVEIGNDEAAKTLGYLLILLICTYL